MKKEDIFLEIYHRHHKGLYNYICRITGDMELARDIFQDVFLQIMSVKDPATLIKYPPKWFYVVAQNVCYKSWNEKKKRETLSNPDENIESYSNNKDPKNIELLEEVNSILGSLGKEHKEIFWLKHETGLKNKDIAEILKISTKTVKRKLDQIFWELQKKIKLSGF